MNSATPWACGTAASTPAPRSARRLPFTYLSLMSYAHQLQAPLTGNVASASAEHAGGSRHAVRRPGTSPTTPSRSRPARASARSRRCCRTLQHADLDAELADAAGQHEHVLLEHGRRQLFAGPPIPCSTTGATCVPISTTRSPTWATRWRRAWAAPAGGRRRNDACWTTSTSTAPNPTSTAPTGDIFDASGRQSAGRWRRDLQGPRSDGLRVRGGRCGRRSRVRAVRCRRRRQPGSRRNRAGRV